MLKNTDIANGKIDFTFEQAGVHDFVWLATDEIIFKQEKYFRDDGTEILIKTYLQPEREGYYNRYVNAVKYSLNFLEKYVGKYPYQTISIVDVPRTSKSGGMEYPTFFTVGAELFSPVQTHWPENLVVHEFTHQYFYGILANNEVYEAWLDEGFTTYFTTKIMKEYYGRALHTFKMARYIPIYGFNFLSYNEIPIIYTLGEIEMGEGARSLTPFYYNINTGSLADTSYLLPNRLSYSVNSYSKPELMLLSLERYLGFNEMMKIMSAYFSAYKFKHPTAKDFIEIVQQNTDEDISWFFNNFYERSPVFDYEIKSINRVSDYEYEVFITRNGDGIFRNEIALYTDQDTLFQYWNDKESWKKFRFVTSNNVIGAEIDPHRNNLLDINFANNSHSIDPQYWGSLSLITRWFFWIQNALMILGSIG
jgi:hypothetical protein